MSNRTHMQYTSVFTWKPKARENHIMFFLICLQKYIHWKHQLPLFSSCNWKWLQPPSLSGYNLREAPTPQLSGYNQKEATTPYVLRLQPKGGYNHLSLPHPSTLKYKCQMMKSLPHYHCEIYHCKHVPINLNHASTMHQPVP